jgi:hypothetical protein
MHTNYDVESWTSSITALLQNKEKRTARVLQGKEHIKKYTWQQTAAKTLAVYREVLS